MASVQERLQLKREPLDKWSVREQLCLASAVCRSGDQNWMSVSRALKPFGEPNRPADWFHQKNCAAQYGMLLGNVETPKRKNKKGNAETGIETPAESILKKLVAERQAELKKLLADEKAEYQKLQKEMLLLQSGKITEEQLDKWCQEIEDEENRKEQETVTHAQWLKERELRKLEIEKAWRPVKTPVGQKRKNSDILDNLIEQEHTEEVPQQQSYPQTPEPSKQAISPLLTSLLKSPSQTQSTPILHTAITIRSMPNTNPMISSLLNSSTGVTVSQGLQQLVISAIGQETSQLIQQQQQQQQQQRQQQQTQQQQTRFEQVQQQHQQQQVHITNDILDDANLPNIKIDDLANSILVQDGPLPEIKKEEVDDIISEIIQADPEQHLQLDGNGDINLGLDDFDDDEALEELQEQQQHEQQQQQEQQQQSKEEIKVESKIEEKVQNPVVAPTPAVDPFEFQEDPVIHMESSLKASSINKQDNKPYVPQYQQQINQVEVNNPVQAPTESSEQSNIHNVEMAEEIKEPKESNVDPKQEAQPSNEPSAPLPPSQVDTPEIHTVKVEESTAVPGSVEIVEVVVTDEDDDTDKDAVKSEILSSTKSDDSEDVKSNQAEPEEKVKSEETEDSSPTESKDTASVATFEESSEASDVPLEVKKEIIESNTDGQDSGDGKPELGDELFDELNIEVKFDKNAKKRDYTRTRKKEDKGFDILLAIEKAHLEESELTEETLSDATTDTDKKDVKSLKIKSDVDRSNSPWTEEEDGTKGGKRRYSTPVTPTDSIPNSPASSSAFLEDDREFRNWKKSVMLVYNRLAAHKYASLFLKPITDDHAPGYSNTIYRPMDLLTIKKNIENGTIRSTLEFKRDIMLMFMNAIMYNRTNSLVYSMASEMQQECIEPIDILMMAESHKDVSLRRETRTSDVGEFKKNPTGDKPIRTKRKRTLTDEILIKSTTKKRKDE